MLFEWNKRLTLQFLNQYKNHSCLWNPCHENYNNKCKKEEALKKIINELKLDTLTIKACLQHIKTIKNIYSIEQEKEIQGLRSNKPYKSQVPWYDLFKGMLLETIIHQNNEANLRKVKSTICVTPEEFKKLYSPTRKVISKSQKVKSKSKNCLRGKRKFNNVKQNFGISSIRRKTHPVINQDIHLYCVHPLSKSFETEETNIKCQAEKESECSEQNYESKDCPAECNKSTSITISKTPSKISIHSKENFYLTKSNSLLKMQPTKHDCHYKRNLETTVPCLSFGKQYKPPMAARDCDNYFKSPTFGSDLHGKKSTPTVFPYSNYTKYPQTNKDIHDVTYLPCTNWRRPIDKDWQSRRYPERDRNYFDFKNNFHGDDMFSHKFNNFTDDTNLRFRKNLDTRDTFVPRSMHTNRYIDNCDCKVLETHSPLKIIIMESNNNKPDAACQSIQLESNGMETSVNTNRTTLCHKETQCYEDPIKQSKSTKTECLQNEIGINCCKSKEMSRTVCVSSLPVDTKYLYQEEKDTGIKCLKCCGSGNVDESEKDDYIQDTCSQQVTIQLLWECLDKMMKLQGKELFQQCPAYANNNFKSNLEQKASLMKNSCTNTAISEDQCCALINEKSSCCFEQFLSKVQVENNISSTDLKLLVDVLKTITASQIENKSNKKDCDDDKIMEYSANGHTRSISLSTQTSDVIISYPLEELSYANIQTSTEHCFEDKCISKTVSSQDFANQSGIDTIDAAVQTEPNKGKINYLYQMSLQDSVCSNYCAAKSMEDQTKIQLKDLNIFSTRTGINESLYKRIKNTTNLKDIEKGPSKSNNSEYSQYGYRIRRNCTGQNDHNRHDPKPKKNTTYF